MCEPLVPKGLMRVSSPTLSMEMQTAASVEASRTRHAEALGTVGRGSRRRRVWELPGAAHCPVIGVCLPIRRLRRLIDKVAGGLVIADDYELHCGVIADCKQRSRTAEAVQRALDEVHVQALRRAARCRTTHDLQQWWRAESVAGDLAGALWATLTHPRCDAPLEERVLRDVHMLQHQLGAAERADAQQLQALMQENGVLTRELAAAQQRSTRVAQEQANKIEQLQAQAVQLRAALIGRDTQLAQLRDAHAALATSVPGLKSRAALSQANQQQAERLKALERALQQERMLTEHQRQRAVAAQQRVEALLAQLQTASQADTVRPPAAAVLNDRAVLCVGGRAASVPAYRALVEEAGARFLHHDGGDENNPAQLEATLAAADLVICQTGCISHDAYWRVKDHCKRTGKECVFVEQPSRSSLQRALVSLSGSGDDGLRRWPVIALNVVR